MKGQASDKKGGAIHIRWNKTKDHKKQAEITSDGVGLCQEKRIRSSHPARGRRETHINMARKTKIVEKGLSLKQSNGDQDSELIARINDCFLSLGADSFENINRLVALCGELLGATCALYNRFNRDMIFSLGQWHTPPDYMAQDKSEGHICYDVVKKGRDYPLIVRDLPDTKYAKTDPNVSQYGLQTYFGQAVKSQHHFVGSVCAVFQSDFIPNPRDQKLLRIVATAIGVEEDRLRVSEHAVRDILTGLYNRHYLNYRLAEEILRAERNQQHLGILLCDLDQFKALNDSKGNRVGDEVLRKVATSILDSTRGIDLVFRWGGDEIVVVLQDASRETVLSIAHRIREGIQKIGESIQHVLDISIGVALYPEHGRTADDLILLADQALYIAKKGGGKIHIGQEEYQLDEDTIKVVFQPIVDVRGNLILGYEALSRDPQGKLNVLQLFNKYQAIGKLIELKIICFKAQLKKAHEGGLERVFINVDFNVLKQVGIIPPPPGLEVILEISELEALHEIENRLKITDRWRAEGYKFAIDDFGAGFISLPFIARLVPEYIKIDRSTMLQAVASEQFHDFLNDLTSALRNYAKEGIIAEGVETEKELRIVKNMGIFIIQGFLLGKPEEIKRSLPSI